jgi:hypothetical protein
LLMIDVPQAAQTWAVWERPRLARPHRGHNLAAVTVIGNEFRKCVFAPR